MLVRLEMDAERMNFAPLDTLPAWAVLLRLAAHLGLGFALGILYFRSLWWAARRFTGRGRLVTTIALTIGRFALVGGVLTLASLEGALPLLIMALGMLVARFAVMNRLQEVAP
jgi:F1-F0 ATPase (N-ATPase) AtpR subunit